MTAVVDPAGSLGYSVDIHELAGWRVCQSENTAAASAIGSRIVRCAWARRREPRCELPYSRQYPRWWRARGHSRAIARVSPQVPAQRGYCLGCRPYQVAIAQVAAGDTAAATRSLDYLFNTQQRDDGSFPQNSRLDGTTCFGSLQLDEVAFPIVLAWHLGRFDADMWAKVQKSADFLVAHGPATPQERWEENGGYSASTIAAEIAGLVTAADIARRNGDSGRADTYLATADNWQANVGAWTVTGSGPLGDGRYYERIDGNGNPNDGQDIPIRNGGGTFDERSIVDAGFLELVRLGVKPADDSEITGSLPELDATIKVDTPNGAMWYCYNHDGYGETADGRPYTRAGEGRLWPILTGERGEYELAAGMPATSHLSTMAAAANPGFMISEQVWGQPDAFGFSFGEGTGSATPLAWSMAQFVRLAHSIEAGEPVETPSVVKERYADARQPAP